MSSNWQGVFIEPAKMILAQVGQFVINIILVIIILIIGWIVSKLIKTLAIKVLRAIKIDEISDRIELDSMLAKGGIQYSLSELIGVVVYWLSLLVTFVVAINAVGLTIAADLLNRIVLYIPNVIAAIFILIAGMFVATLLRNIVRAAANNTGLSQSNLLGKVVEIIIMVFAVAIALEQLNIGAKVIELTISIILGSFGLGFALAFGLGCKDIVAKSVGEFLDKIKRK
ncbi:MAG: hypothetical protein PHT31_05690 [Candidatus Omnitrophica bacterium]|nr:hypothetical protein [Candidatus Omnitrophota bacterium]